MRLRQDSELGAVVRSRRQELGLTQSELATRAGVTRQFVARLESGGTEVTLSKAFGVLRALGLAVHIEVPSAEAAHAAPTPAAAATEAPLLPRVAPPRLTTGRDDVAAWVREVQEARRAKAVSGDE